MQFFRQHELLPLERTLGLGITVPASVNIYAPIPGRTDDQDYLGDHLKLFELAQQRSLQGYPRHLYDAFPGEIFQLVFNHGHGATRFSVPVTKAEVALQVYPDAACVDISGERARLLPSVCP